MPRSALIIGGHSINDRLTHGVHWSLLTHHGSVKNRQTLLLAEHRFTVVNSSMNSSLLTPKNIQTTDAVILQLLVGRQNSWLPGGVYHYRSEFKHSTIMTTHAHANRDVTNGAFDTSCEDENQ